MVRAGWRLRTNLCRNIRTESYCNVELLPPVNEVRPLSADQAAGHQLLPVQEAERRHQELSESAPATLLLREIKHRNILLPGIE